MEAEEEETPAHRAQPGAPNRPIDQAGSTSAISLWISVPFVRRRGTWPTTAESLPTGKNGTSC